MAYLVTLIGHPLGSVTSGASARTAREIASGGPQKIG